MVLLIKEIKYNHIFHSFMFYMSNNYDYHQYNIIYHFLLPNLLSFMPIFFTIQSHVFTSLYPFVSILHLLQSIILIFFVIILTTILSIIHIYYDDFHSLLMALPYFEFILLFSSFLIFFFVFNQIHLYFDNSSD